MGNTYQQTTSSQQTSQKTQDNILAGGQRARLLQHLKIAPVDTLEARRNLDILHPAARCMELRKQYRIDTVRVTRHTDADKPHHVALYILRGELRHE